MNRYYLTGKKQNWVYSGGCDYKGVPDNFHKGKVEFHHPCKEV